jgi:hypothetical protein
MFTNRIRLPFQILRPQFPTDASVFRFADGTSKMVSSTVKKQYEGETDYLPAKWHERLVIALSHDNVTIEGDVYLGSVVRDGDYTIDWPKFMDYPTGKAAFTVDVTPFDNTNSNCQTCEEAIQLSLVDDEMPTAIVENHDYNINVADNDNICCYPAVFSLTSFNATYLATASIDQDGNFTFHTKPSFTSGTGIKIATYRVTCPNGGYDEADVFADASGSVTPGCVAPTNLALITSSSTTASLSFTPAIPAPNHYYWRLYVTGAMFNIQAGTVAGSPINLSGLTASTSYTLYLRSQCDATNNDSPASAFIQLQFMTPGTDPANPGTCGQYLLNYNNPAGGAPSTTRVTYLDCNGSYQTTFVANHILRIICAMQTSHGLYTSIVLSDPGHTTITAGSDDESCS